MQRAGPAAAAGYRRCESRDAAQRPPAAPVSGADLRMPRPEEAVHAEADQPQRHQGEQDRPERRVVHGAQRIVQAAGLLGVIGDGRPAEQPADDDVGDALDDVPGLAEPDDLLADTAGEVVGELLLDAAADQPDAQHDDRDAERDHQDPPERRGQQPGGPPLLLAVARLATCRAAC